MIRMVPTTMPTRPMASPRAQTTVSVSSDIGVGISGSEKKETHEVKGHCMETVYVGNGVCLDMHKTSGRGEMSEASH